MKRGARLDPQEQFIEYCIDLLTPGLDLNESADNIDRFLNEASLQEIQDINFNVKIEQAPVNGKILTGLAFVVEAALNGQSGPLKTILNRADPLKLDFNAESSNGTLLRKVALKTAKNIHSSIFPLILKTIDVQRLDFNAITQDNKNTVLHFIMSIAAQGNLGLLKTILSEPDLSFLDFNAKSNDGDTPLWWLALFFANGKLDSQTLESVFDKVGISKLDFNAKMNTISMTALYLLTTAASQGHVGPLLKISKKELISNFDVSKDIQIAILINLVLTAIKGYPNPLKEFLSNEAIAAGWDFDEKLKNTLLQETDEKIREILLNRIANEPFIFKGEEALSVCISTGNTEAALACIKAGASKRIRGSLLDAIKNGYDEAVKTIFPHYHLYGVPIFEILNGKIPDSIEDIKEILECPTPYLRSQELYTDKIFELQEKQLIQYCKDLFSLNGEGKTEIVNEVVDNLTTLLQDIPLQKINFNRTLSEGPFKGNTLLWVIGLAAYKERLLPLKVIVDKLNEEEIRKLDFNAPPPDGKYQGRTVLWLVAKLATFKDVYPSSIAASDVLKVIINKSDITKLNFDAKAEKGRYKNQTVLLLVTKIGGELPLFLLEAILSKGQLAQLNFNAKEDNGATTPLWYLAHIALEDSNPTPLQLLLERQDISVLDFNAMATYRRKTVLYEIIEAAAHGWVNPLRTILNNKEVISQLDFDSRPRGRRSISFLLVLIAMAGYPELLRQILSVKQINSKRFDERAQKLLFHGSQAEIRSLFHTRILNNKKGLHKNLLSFIRFGFTQEALACIKAGADTNNLHTVLCEALDKGHDETVEKIFPYYELYGIPISTILENKKFFDNFDNINEFLLAEDLFDFIGNLCSEQTYWALTLLKQDWEVRDYKASLKIGNETASSDSKFAQANWHFNKNVQPTFQKRMLFFGKCEKDAIDAIEKKIRELILDTIVEQAQDTIKFATNNIQIQKSQALIHFVTQNRKDLLEMKEEVMKASCSEFKSEDRNHTALAAWRGYNPYDPVCGVDPNLLTPPTSNKKIWTTVIDHKDGKRDPMEVYHLLKQRIAYYYLVVTDKKEGDKNTRRTRKKNFLAQLEGIRNAKGINEVSCYPGTVTRIGDMGAFHPTGQLPPTTEEWLEDHFKTKILVFFEKKLKSLPTMKEKEALYQALTELTRHNAKEVIIHPHLYNEEWFGLLQDFIKELGTPKENLETLFQQDLFPVVDKDLVFIAQILTDIAGNNKMYCALTDCFNNHVDRSPTQEELKSANTFEADTENHKLCQLLLDAILKLVPHYSKSIRQLGTLTAFLQQKVPMIPKSGKLKVIFEGLKIENQTEVLKTIEVELQKMSWWAKSLVTNPFDSKVCAIQIMIKQNTDLNTIKQFLTTLENQQKRQDLFNRYYPCMQVVFKASDPTTDFLSHVTEAIVMFIDFHKEWNIEKFKEDLEEGKLSGLNVVDKFFLDTHFELLSSLKLSESIDSDLRRSYTPSFNAVNQEKINNVNNFEINKTVTFQCNAM